MAATTPNHPFQAWRLDCDGKLVERRDVLADELKTLVASTVAANGRLVAVTYQIQSTALAAIWQEATGAISPKVRPLTGPHVVPDDWAGDVGAPGWIVGTWRAESDSQPLVLAGWNASAEDLTFYVQAIDRRVNEGGLTSLDRIRTMLERPIRPRVAKEGVEPHDRERFAEALRTAETTVDRYEEGFRDGDDFTWEEHVRIEQLLQELVLHKGGFPSGTGMEAERQGLESRLVRLLNAQSSRDASGALQRVIGALTALVLVPTLIAGAFGANVPIPFEEEPAIRKCMFAFMACGGVLTYVLLSSVRQDTTSRRLGLRLPGARRTGRGGDQDWVGRCGFAALLGVALGTTFVALVGIFVSDAQGIETSTTATATWIAGALTSLLLLALMNADRSQRTWRHVFALVWLAAVGWVAAVALLWSGPWLGALALVGTVVAACFWRWPHARAFLDLESY